MWTSASDNSLITRSYQLSQAVVKQLLLNMFIQHKRAIKIILSHLCLSVDIPWLRINCSTISNLLNANLWWVLLLTGLVKCTGIMCNSRTHLQSAILSIVWTAMLWILGVVSPDLVNNSGSNLSTLLAISVEDTLRW